MKYIYQARDKQGKIETGTVEASSKEAAALLLQKYNIFVTSIKEQDFFVFRTENLTLLNKVSKKDLAIFSRQLAVMLESRVSVIKSLKSLASQTKNPVFRIRIIKVSQLVEEGNSLSEALLAFPDTFDNFYISLLKTGEASGKISESLYYLSNHLEKEYDMVSKIKGAMAYPAFVLAAVLLVIPMVIFFVMPRIIDLIKETTSEPPVFTKMMIEFYSFLENYGWIILVGLFLLVLFIAYYFTTKEGRKRFDVLSLKIPGVKEVLKKIYLSRFAGNLSTLISAGLSINNALKITTNTVNNSVYKNIFSETEKGVSQGESISSILSRYPEYAPPFVVQMIEVGEETGTLDKNLMEIVNFYNKEVNRAIDQFTAMLEPALIIIMGVLVAFMAVSVIQPLYGALGTI